MNQKPAILDHAATLADLTRCRALHLLGRHELTVSELCAVLQLPQSTVSRHLKVLADGDWVRVRRDGTRHLYSLPVNGLDAAAARLWDLIRDQTADTPAGHQDRQRLAGVLSRRRSRSQEFFSSTAEQWHRLRDELFGCHFDLLALVGLLDADWVVGDLGCGTGQLSEALAPHVREVVAVDGSPAMLAAARERLARFGNVRIREGDLEKLPLADRQLDAATLLLVIHHVPEPGRVLAEAQRVLKPGGRLLIVDMMPHDREEYRQQMGHVWLGFSGEQTTRLLAASGLVAGRYQPLPVDPQARGPALFVATAGRPRDQA